MSKKSRWFILLSVLIVASMLLSACKTATQAPEPTKAAEEPTKAPRADQGGRTC